jgi:hypothetical protein
MQVKVGAGEEAVVSSGTAQWRNSEKEDERGSSEQEHYETHENSGVFMPSCIDRYKT